MRSQSDLRLGRRLTAAALSGLLAMSSVVPYAFAQPQPPAGAGQPAAKPTTEQEKKDAARSHFGEGKKRLEAKDYAGALAEFQIANDLVPAAQPLYKIGACYDGMGKSAEVPVAIKKGVEDAKKNMFKVALTHGTVPHAVVGRFGAGRVMIKPAAPGTGIIAGGPIRALFELCGITDILSKSLGSDNALNMVKAAAEGLRDMASASTIARRRGMTVGRVFGWEE